MNEMLTFHMSGGWEVQAKPSAIHWLMKFLFLIESTFLLCFHMMEGQSSSIRLLFLEKWTFIAYVYGCVCSCVHHNILKESVLSYCMGLEDWLRSSGLVASDFIPWTISLAFHQYLYIKILILLRKASPPEPSYLLKISFFFILLNWQLGFDVVPCWCEDYSDHTTKHIIIMILKESKICEEVTKVTWDKKYFEDKTQGEITLNSEKNFSLEFCASHILVLCDYSTYVFYTLKLSIKFISYFSCILSSWNLYSTKIHYKTKTRDEGSVQ